MMIPGKTNFLKNTKPSGKLIDTNLSFEQRLKGKNKNTIPMSHSNFGSSFFPHLLLF